MILVSLFVDPSMGFNIKDNLSNISFVVNVNWNQKACAA